jgi:hypothetical protein
VAVLKKAIFKIKTGGNIGYNCWCYTLKLGRYVAWDVPRWVHFVCFKMSRDLSSELIPLFFSVPDIFCLNVYLVFCHSVKMKVKKIEFSAALRMCHLRKNYKS